jgi:hypothetical protein
MSSISAVPHNVFYFFCILGWTLLDACKQGMQAVAIALLEADIECKRTVWLHSSILGVVEMVTLRQIGLLIDRGNRTTDSGMAHMSSLGMWVRSLLMTLIEGGQTLMQR